MKRNVYTGMDSFAERQRLARQHEAARLQREGMHEAKAIHGERKHVAFRCEACGSSDAWWLCDGHRFCNDHRNLGEDELRRNIA